MNKIALCFIINYEHILNKENIWREWIKYNKDIINVYFYYSDKSKIKSEWILKHTIPPEYIHKTSYLHVIPAYFSILKYALNNDINNKWFCLLTDSCCPIISPTKFKNLFLNHMDKTIMKWKPPWWNIYFHKRANLALLPLKLRLANEPWFVIKREHVKLINQYFFYNPKNVKLISDGGFANESLFAIILMAYNQLKTEFVECSITHLTDWSRMTSATSPYVFKEATIQNIHFIENAIKLNPFCMFIRKVSPEFPNEVINKFLNFEQEEKEKEEEEEEEQDKTKPTQIARQDIRGFAAFNFFIIFIIFYYYYTYFTNT